MSVIFGETLTFGQEKGPDVRLVVFGDEFYARYENRDGYTVVYDAENGLFCYAILLDRRLVSSGVPISAAAPAGTRKHLEEAEDVRHQKFGARWQASMPPPNVSLTHETMRTFGPNKGLMNGRRLSAGTVTGLTILVEFQDVTTTVTQADVSELLNGENYTRNGNFCSVREYFRMISSGKLDYINEVVGPFKLSKNRHYYTQTSPIREALDLAVAAGADLSRYDSKGEGIVDALSILYAGQTQYIGELWPHNWYIDLRYGNMKTYLYMLSSLGRSANDLSIGTFCHETGHLLCRFPDLYDYGNRDGDGVESAGIGVYCLMGSGNHLNFGRSPSPVCAYLRDLAGWCETVIDLKKRGSYAAGHGKYNVVMRFDTDKQNEYFLIENRSKIGLDQDLPSSGLAVYHCDINGSNEWQEGSSSRHFQCALLQADGHLDLENNMNQGDGGDLFGLAAGPVLSHATKPSTRQWDNADSGLIVSDVGSPGIEIAFTIGEGERCPVRGEATPALAIPDNDPNGITSAIQIDHPGSAEKTVIGVDITHTYTGDLVVDLIGPAGQKVTLHNRSGASKDNLIETYTPDSLPALKDFIGKPIQGAWTLHVRDVAGQDLGKLNRWSVEICPEVGATSVTKELSPAAAIPDDDPAGVASTIMVEAAGIAQSLKVSIDISHPFVGDLRVELLSPAGRSAILHSRLGGPQDNLVTDYESGPGSPLNPLLGQPVQGNWILRVADLAGRDVGTLNRWGLQLTL